MKKTLLTGALFLAAFSSSIAQKAESVPPVVAAERAFAALGVNGTKEAFLAVLDDEGILFRPKPVNGKLATEKSPSSPSLLSWYPEYAELAPSGEMGFTTGPFEFRINATDKDPVSTGHYVSMWRKNANGTWKLMLDIGTGHPKVIPAPAFDFAKAVEPKKVAKPVANQSKARQQLLSSDQAFAAQAAAQGEQAAYAAHLSPTARFYREGHAPVIGKTQILPLLKPAKETISFTPNAAQVSLSGDFGYTYGLGTEKQGDKASSFSYARFWRKDSKGNWQIILDITNPFPPANS